MTIVKRVIGLPGDTIEITTEGIFINGSLLQEDYLPQENKDATFIAGGYNSVPLGEDEYYLVGDNRGNSNDSRWFGPVKETDLISKQSETITMHFMFKILIIIATIAVAYVLYTVLDRVFKKFFK